MEDHYYFSAERLIEFGLGMAMARQMVTMMNQSMAQATAPQSEPQTIYVGIDGNPVGPMSMSAFSQLASKHKVNKDTLVWMPGMVSWQPVIQVPAALRVVAMTPPPLPAE